MRINLGPVIFVILCLFVVFAYGIENKKKIVCYYTNWSQYRPEPGKFVPENVDPFLCTHVIYAFAKLTDDRLEAFEWNDPSTEWSKGMYERIMALKNKNKKLKILLAVGGWNLGPGPFSAIANDEDSRAVFVETTIDFLQKHKFDGLDLDWEYPGSRDGSDEADKESYTILIKELKEAFLPHDLLLTAAVGAGYDTINKGYEIDKISEHLDFINLMAYDLHGSWESFVGHNAPLYAREDEDEEQSRLNVDWVVKYWLEKGAPKEKLILGMPTYGRTFTLASSSKNTPGAGAKGTGNAGRFTREAGFLSFYEICEKMKRNWTRKYDEEQKVPYVFKKTEWVSYDDVNSIRLKARYLLDMDLGGAMFWSLDSDDFLGKYCKKGKFPLINAAKSVIENDEEVVEEIETEPPTTTKTTTTKKKKTTTKKSEEDFNETSDNGEDDDDKKNEDENEDDEMPASEMAKLVEKRCTKGDGYYVDYDSKCSKYYICLFTRSENAMIQNLRCPSGLIFDLKLKTCNYASNVKCTPEALSTKLFKTTKTTTMKTTKTTTTPKPVTKSSVFTTTCICGTEMPTTLDNEEFSTLENRKETTTTTTTKTTLQPVTQLESKEDSLKKVDEEIEPPKSTQCLNGNGFYLYPDTNCTKYYFCSSVNPKLVKVYNFTCNENKKFNINKKKCEKDLKCGDLSEVKKSVVASTTSSSRNDLLRNCVNGDGYYADRTRECQFYYQCLFTRTKYAQAIEKSCGENLIFDQKMRKCMPKSDTVC